jgi:peptide/nickel transport system substrate-binding protein
MQWAGVALLFIAVLAGCGQPARPVAPAGPGSSSAVSVGPRTLTAAVHYEPPVLSPKHVEATGRVQDPIRFFNASLALLDGLGRPQPYLAEALPQLNTPDWQVFPDGRMETTYHLRPSLTWQDGTPLAAEDFILAWQVYTDPQLGMFFATPQDKIEAVTAPDPRTVVITWRVLYPDAAALKTGDLEPLPRHLLERPFATYQQDPAAQHDAFANLPYWTTAYLGLGPFRLERWEPGASFEATAFDGHALGRARIDRLIVHFMTDDNTVFASMLAENLQLALRAIRFEQGMGLKRAWAAQGRGDVVFIAGGTNTTMVQMRPDFLKVPELMDLRVRKALAHSIDRQALDDGLFEGQGLMSETYITREASYYADLDRAITKYPYDPRRSEQLMAEAGLFKDRDSLFLSATGERLAIPYLVVGGTEYERQGAIMTDIWRRAGFDIQQSILPAIQMSDNHARATFPGLLHNPLGVGERTAEYFTASQAGTPANRWGGNNRGGWSHPEYERLFDAYRSTLDITERNRRMIDMMAFLSEQLPAFQAYFRFDILAYLSELHGPAVVNPDTRSVWNIHEWQLS